MQHAGTIYRSGTAACLKGRRREIATSYSFKVSTIHHGNGVVLDMCSLMDHLFVLQPIPPIRIFQDNDRTFPFDLCIPVDECNKELTRTQLSDDLSLCNRRRRDEHP